MDEIIKDAKIHSPECDEELVKKLTDEIVEFGKYGFNKCLTGDTVIQTNYSKPITINEIKDKLANNKEVELLSYLPDKNIYPFDKCLEVIDAGIQDVYLIEFSDGSSIKATLDHKFLCVNKEYKTLREIFENNLEMIA